MNSDLINVNKQVKNQQCKYEKTPKKNDLWIIDCIDYYNPEKLNSSLSVQEYSKSMSKMEY